MCRTTTSMDNCYAAGHAQSANRVLSGIARIWIKVLFISLIFALVQTSTPPTSIPLQKRGDFFYYAFTENENDRKRKSFNENLKNHNICVLPLFLSSNCIIETLIHDL